MEVSAHDNRREIWAGWFDLISSSAKLWHETEEHAGPAPPTNNGNVSWGWPALVKFSHEACIDSIFLLAVGSARQSLASPPSV